ncbi:MAG TPA: putative colanic acid biosynthesis acetyltransferase [Steroidobacteraceae bacterium]|jgi:putative colanic acid biosynthesis acetyltransferase WcaF|nr:putative colanic acid biosynthesis acetyltransferase [Steroidobacteraceae bacterium]
MTRSFPLIRAEITFGQRVRRFAWNIVWMFLYRPTPRPFHAWRRLLLRAFGARISAGAVPYAAARIWAPWNLTMGAHSCLSDFVDCYCVAPITLGPHSTVSQYAYLCSASHDYREPGMPLVIAPIVIGPDAWVAAGAFIGPGIAVGAGAVVGARSTVTRDVDPWSVVAGSPARPTGSRPRFTRS